LSEKVIDIKERFSVEISNIEYILQGLENGLVTDLHPNSKMYGSLAHNVEKLRKELNNVMNRIQYGKESVIEEMNEAFATKKE
jgi:hypothetical protein